MPRTIQQPLGINLPKLLQRQRRIERRSNFLAGLAVGSFSSSVVAITIGQAALGGLILISYATWVAVIRVLAWALED